MALFKSVFGKAALVTLAVLGFAGAAQAGGNVYWSVGVGSPGVSVGISNAHPVYVQPAPVYYQQPVYLQPAPVYYQPQPVYVQPAPVYYGYDGYRRHNRHHDRHDDGHHGSHRQGHFVQNHAPQPFVHGPHGFRPAGYYYGR